MSQITRRSMFQALAALIPIPFLFGKLRASSTYKGLTHEEYKGMVGESFKYTFVPYYESDVLPQSITHQQ